ncbi:MAG: magnesium chelatase domain-containing protein [Chloroflexota bacterium]
MLLEQRVERRHELRAALNLVRHGQRFRDLRGRAATEERAQGRVPLHRRGEVVQEIDRVGEQVGLVSGQFGGGRLGLVAGDFLIDVEDPLGGATPRPQPVERPGPLVPGERVFQVRRQRLRLEGVDLDGRQTRVGGVHFRLDDGVKVVLAAVHECRGGALNGIAPPHRAAGLERACGRLRLQQAGDRDPARGAVDNVQVGVQRLGLFAGQAPGQPLGHEGQIAAGRPSALLRWGGRCYGVTGEGSVVEIEVMEAGAPIGAPARVLTGATVGLDTALVEVEVDLAQGLPHSTVVGLPDAAVQEAREQVRAAVRNSGFPFPNRRRYRCCR